MFPLMRRHRSPIRLPLPPLLALAGALALTAIACDDGQTPPELLPVDARQVAVNEPLVIDLAVENPDGLALDWTVTAPMLPSFDEVSALAGTPTGAEFQWTPLASHVGTHELVFSVDSEAGRSETSVIVTVTPAASAAPVFLRPGFGGTFDLGKDPCVAFDIEVRDDDSLEVELLAREPLPDGAGIEPDIDTSKRARFEWCPSQEQVERNLRWNIALAADDGEHEPATPHDYLIVLRTPARDNCEGQPPTIAVNAPAEGATVGTPGGYVVEIDVTDDRGVRDQPILYYTAKPPEDDADLSDFEQTLFESTGTTTWRATIPPLALEEGQTQTLYFFVEATDNDDPSGTSCDHRVETPVRKFTAAPAGEGAAADCAVCTASSQCTSGLCVASGNGGRCLPSCGAACAAGTCQSLPTVEGQSTMGCGDVMAVCSSTQPDMCVNDGDEPSDSLADAKTVGAGPIQATICPADIDLWRVDATSTDLDVTLTLSDFDTTTADLDLWLLDGEAKFVAESSTSNPTESLSYCLPAGGSSIATVIGYNDDDYSDYTLTVDQQPGSCCIDDAGEPDSTQATARAANPDGSFDGTICVPDDDWIAFEVTEAGELEVVVVFEDGMNLDLELYGPDGGFVTGAWSDSVGDETLTATLPTPGTWKLLVIPYGDLSGDYTGLIALGALSGCTATNTCPRYNVCSDAGECVADNCATTADCPASHGCQPAGPGQDYGYCAATCTGNSSCRSTEACKWFANGTRGCGEKGSAQNGQSCTFFEDCGGQRDCLDLPGGYCARAGCTSNADCESDTFCSSVDGLNVCVRRCGGTEPACRLAEGYACTSLAVVGAAGTMDNGCVAP